MKTFLLILLLTCSVLAQQEQQHAMFTPKKVALVWEFRGETRPWLSANYYGSDFDAEGFHPSFVYLMSQYKPQIVKQKNGQWLISFSSDLPDPMP